MTIGSHGTGPAVVIGGVGLGRYLDPAQDGQKYAPAPALGWQRGYRSSDLVRADPAGLLFIGPADDQVKLGGRRIELGEVDAALRALPGVCAAAAAVKTTAGAAQVLAGYIVPDRGAAIEPTLARQALARRLPAALVPRIVVPDIRPTRTSGKVDRASLPWPPLLDRQDPIVHNPLVLLCIDTPLYALHLRALGARIGAGVLILTSGRTG